jgi:hypothetical protein
LPKSEVNVDEKTTRRRNLLEAAYMAFSKTRENLAYAEEFMAQLAEELLIERKELEE